MTQKFSELRQAVTLRRCGKGRGAHYVAECPLCDYSHSVDVLSSEISAEAMAKQNVLTHLRAHHAHEIDLDV